MAIFIATTGTDTFIGSGADDTFVFTDLNQVTGADTFDGGGGTDTLQFGDTNFIQFDSLASDGVQGLISIEALTFTRAVFGSTARFRPEQFGTGLVSDNLAVTGVDGAAQTIEVDMNSGGVTTFSAAGWTFDTWEAGSDRLRIIDLTSGATTITGSSQNDYIETGHGADELTGGGGRDTFGFEDFYTDPITIGGSGTSGTISGYKIITDFGAGNTAATTDVLHYHFSGSGNLSVAAAVGTVDGTDSTLLVHTGSAIQSHTITDGIASFYADNAGTALISLTSLSDVAAAVQYLRANPFASFGETAAFRASIGGIAHTYVWTKADLTGFGPPDGMFFDLQGASATGLETTGGGDGNVFVLDTAAEGRLTVDRLIDASEVANAPFTLAGLEAGATAVVTFSDGVHPGVDSAPLTADGSYGIDLSALDDGRLVVTLTVTDGAGNVTVSHARSFKNTSTSFTTSLISWADWGGFEAAEAAANGSAFTTITIRDKGSNLQALTAADIAELGAGGVTNIDSTNDRVTLNVAQYNALLTAGIAIAAGDKVVLADTGANLATVLGSDLAGNGVDVLDATDDALSITLAQFGALGSVTLTKADTVAVVDGDFSTLTSFGIQQLGNGGIDIIDMASNALTLRLDQFDALGPVIVAAADALAVQGTPGNDVFRFTRQAFTGNDAVIGGAGSDTLVLYGDRSLTFGAGALSGIEKVTLRAGDFTLATQDGTVAAGDRLEVSGKRLGIANTFTFDGSAENDGSFSVRGGAGTNTLTGGAGRDALYSGHGDNILTGRGGADTLVGLSAAGVTDTFGFAAVADSTGATYDTVTGFDAAVDSFDLWGGTTVAGMDSAITTGFLRPGAAFDDTLEAAVGPAGLLANHAVLFTPDAGNLAGATFLVVDVNGSAGYQAGQDLVVRLGATTGTIGTGNFS
jgi:hypothetical protein